MDWAETYIKQSEAEAIIANLKQENEGLTSSVKALEELRPHWAQGYTSDARAASAATAALSQVWVEIGATNQTEAMIKLREMRRLYDQFHSTSDSGE